jgi:signal transduction histidine kinase
MAESNTGRAMADRAVINSLKNDYADLLRRYLQGEGERLMAPVRQLGQRALAAGLCLCDLAEIHLETLSLLLPALRGRPECPAIRNSGTFFAWTILPFERSILDSHEAVAALHHQNGEFEERAGQVAHSINEDILQLLAAARIMMHDCPAGPSSCPPRIAVMLDSIESRLRSAAYELRPCILDDLGLSAAADWLVRKVGASAGVHAELATRLHCAIPADLATTLFRALQEALANVAVHAHAAHVRVRLDDVENTIRCTIADDGLGFEPRAVFDAHGARGLGLIGIRENLRVLGGWLSVDSAPGRGTEVVITVPLPAVE